MDLAGIAGLGDEAHLGAGLLPDQVVVDGGGEQQGRDRRVDIVGVAVRQHDDAGAVVDGLADLGADAVQGPLQRQATARHAVQAGHHHGLEPSEVSVEVDVDDLGQLVVADDRVGQHHLAAARRAGSEQVALRPDRGAERGHQFLPDGVQRRVGDLGEELLEVVEQQAGPLGQHRDGGVGPHRADGLVPGPGHRGDDDLQLLVGVAEHLLAAADAVVAVDDVLALGKAAEVDDAGMQPLVVGVLGGELGLDLLVVDHAALRGVHQQHPPRLQAALPHDSRRVDVHHADLGGHDHQVVVGHPKAARAQAVAVEDGADHRPVGERDRGGAVPGLHQGGVEAVEGPLGRVHLIVVLPRLGDHHEHGVGQAAAAQMEELQHLVEAGRVRGTGSADGVGPLQVARDGVGRQERLAGAHPVAVALNGIDLAVVGDEAVRVGQRPRREGVGREPAVHERQAPTPPARRPGPRRRRRAGAPSASPCRSWCGPTGRGSRRRATRRCRRRFRARGACAAGRRAGRVRGHWIRRDRTRTTGGRPASPAGPTRRPPPGRPVRRANRARPAPPRPPTARWPPPSSHGPRRRREGSRCPWRSGPSRAAGGLTPPARSGRGPAGGCRLRPRCPPRRPWHRGAPGCRARRRPARRCAGWPGPWTSTTNATPHPSCSNRGSYSPVGPGGP